LPFEDSRRLTGSNLFFTSTGAVLELVGMAPDESLVAGWRERVGRARQVLGWQDRHRAGDALVEPDLIVRPHQRGATFALAAPCDQLFTATEVNEWALCATLAERDPMHWSGLEGAMLAAVTLDNDGIAPADPAVLDELPAMARLRRLAGAEARPALRKLLAAASVHRLSHVLDDDELTLGSGRGSITWRLDSLPDPTTVPWATLGDVPTAVITGSNGKTTTVRLVAACAREQGSVPGHNCTDGIVIDGVTVEPGDYAGPVGARRVLRDTRVGTVVIEAARGGVLRRGLALGRAQVAVVTNVSADHFGEYGIDDLAALADVKLTVGRVLVPDGLLVLNADDPTLVGRAPGLAARYGREPRIGWFALDADAPLLVAQVLQQFHAKAVGQAHVADDHVEAFGLQLLACFEQGGGGIDAVALAQQGQLVQGAQVGFVVDHQDGCGRCVHGHITPRWCQTGMWTPAAGRPCESSR